MNDDDYLESLRGEARALRYEPGEITLGRIEARVRERVVERETVAGTLAGWLRPLAGAMFAAAAISVATLVWLSIEPADALLAGTDISIAEDYYRVAR
jgi:PPE-repeat protein